MPLGEKKTQLYFAHFCDFMGNFCGMYLNKAITEMQLKSSINSPFSLIAGLHEKSSLLLIHIRICSHLTIFFITARNF